MRLGAFWRGLTGALLVGAVLSCSGDDDPTGIEDLDFPALSSQLIGLYCVRDNVTVGSTPSGTLLSTDCDIDDVSPGDEGYFEVFLVKVRSTRSVTFTVNSEFDSYLSLLELVAFTSNDADLELLAEDDDSATQNGVDARLTFTLQPDRDYVIALSGFDYAETGNYSLSIR
jgi:hypothetical protein